MVLHGDQDIRIDMTNPANQITGLDLNGNGAIANDGKENASTSSLHRASPLWMPTPAWTTAW